MKPFNLKIKISENHLLDEAVTSDKLIRGVAALCGLLWVVRHDSALFLLLIPLFFQIFWKLGKICIFKLQIIKSKIISVRIFS